MSKEDTLLELAKSLSAALEQGRFQYAFGGAFANMMWGIPRTTIDLDLMVAAAALEMPRLFQIFSDLGCKFDLAEVLQKARDNYYVSVEHPIGDVEIFFPVLGFHREVLERRIKCDVDNGQMWFVSPEDLIILKMIFHRSKDISDIEGIIAVQGDKLNKQYIYKTFKIIVPKGDPRHQKLELLLKNKD